MVSHNPLHNDYTQKLDIHAVDINLKSHQRDPLITQEIPPYGEIQS